MRFPSSIYATWLVLGLANSPTYGMTFSTKLDPEHGINVIVAEGPIVQGDASRLEKIIPLAGRDEFGNIPIYLNSPGGSVEAAFAMVEVMERMEFSALVNSDAACASACSSIIYISARFHQVLGSGRIGIHTCYSSSGPKSNPEPSAMCNHRIAENAYNHGTSYGAIDMWASHVGPDDMAWIGRALACEYGLCGPPGFDDTPAIPSFSCAAATQPSELAICGDKRLARHEASLTKYYHEALNKLSPDERTKFRNTQRAWLKFRDSSAARKSRNVCYSG
jgi:Lysozyme inhibitor LprI/Clp protease